MKIYFASDHAGFHLKNILKEFVHHLGFRVEDCGAYEFDDKDDFPDFISTLAKKLVKDYDAKGIILGGSGQGEAMIANRFPGLRATVYYGGNEDIIRLSRLHNDANVLSLGARFIDEDTAKSMVRLWLETPFSEHERHIRRISKMDKIG